MALVQVEDDQIIKPEAVTPAVDTSEWPLLLKNWNKCTFRLLLLLRWPRVFVQSC